MQISGVTILQSATKSKIIQLCKAIFWIHLNNGKVNFLTSNSVSAKCVWYQNLDLKMLFNSPYKLEYPDI